MDGWVDVFDGQLMVKASQWESADPQVHVVLGVLYNASRNYDAAVAAFRTALVSMPDDYTLWNKVRTCLSSHAHPLLMTTTTCPACVPPDPHPLTMCCHGLGCGCTQLGATLANSERSVEAIPFYEKSLSIKPRYARGSLNLGIALANVGNYMVRLSEPPSYWHRCVFSALMWLS